MKRKFKLSLWVLFVTVGNLYGQSDFRPGFIITFENDTIPGQVDYRSNSQNYESCIFKSERDEIEYFPGQILGFGYTNDKFFSSLVVEGAFAEVVVSGRISLYRYKDKFHIQKDTLLIALESIMETAEINGKRVRKETSRWRGYLSYFISDCLQNPQGLTSDIKFTEKELTRLVVKYNKCSGEEFIEYKVSKPWTRFDIGASIGVSRSEIRTSEKSGSFDYLDNSYRSVDPSIGVLVAISSPRIIEKVAFQGEIHFMKTSYSSLVELDGPSIEYHDTFINLTTLSIPLSIRYSWPEKKYGMYLQGGVNLDYHLDSDTRVQSEWHTSDNVVNTLPERSAFIINDNQLGYWGGIGILKSYKRFKGSIAIRYFQMLSLNSGEGFIANNNRISINLILLKR